MIDVHYQWIDMSKDKSTLDQGTAILEDASTQLPESKPPCFQSTLRLTFGTINDKISKNTVSLFSYLRLPSQMQSEFLDNWNRARVEQGRESIFEDMCTHFLSSPVYALTFASTQDE
jgi:hypothetical protein